MADDNNSSGFTGAIKKSLKPDKSLKFVDFKELDKYVTEVLNDPNIQEFLLISLLENYDIEADAAVQIFGRWYQSGNPLIKNLHLMHFIA